MGFIASEVDEQNREFLHLCEYYAAVLGGEYGIHGNVALACCGVRNLTFNTAALAGVVASEEEITQAINTSMGYFEQRGTDWSFVLCDAYVPEDIRAALPLILTEHRLDWFWAVTGMVTDGLGEPSRVLPPLVYRQVDDEVTAFAVVDINARAYGIDREFFTDVLMNPKLWTDRHLGYVGFVDDRPVVTAVVYRGESAIGLYWVATEPELQRTGYAEAAMRHAVAQARTTWGMDRTILQSTQKGLPLYQRMGFRHVTRFDYYSL
jgi:GNAT superfamily N-acetyltransferase